MSSFQIQQQLLGGKTSAVSRKRMVAANNPMARRNDGNSLLQKVSFASLRDKTRRKSIKKGDFFKNYLATQKIIRIFTVLSHAETVSG